MARWRSDVAALVACGVLWWFGMRGARVPLLAWADLGFHELGHFVAYAVDLCVPWPEVLTAAMGSVFQVAVPVGFGLYFLSRRSDEVGASVCLAWAATSAADVARYVRDAPFERLPLIGGEHDWATILGPRHLDRLAESARWAATVDRLAWLLLAVAVVLPLWSLLTYGRRRDAILQPLRHRQTSGRDLHR